MAEETAADFNVVDRRQAASQEASQQPAEAESQSAASDDDETYSPADLGADGDASQLPDPSFLITMAAMQMQPKDFIRSLIVAFDGQALRSIGLYADPITGSSTKDLPAAQLAIDCIQFLYGKVDNVLSDDERKEAQRRLSFLRMNYLAQLKG